MLSKWTKPLPSGWVLPIQEKIRNALMNTMAAVERYMATTEIAAVVAHEKGTGAWKEVALHAIWGL
jgi:hypothetical protein